MNVGLQKGTFSIKAVERTLFEVMSNRMDSWPPFTINKCSAMDFQNAISHLSARFYDSCTAEKEIKWDKWWINTVWARKGYVQMIRAMKTICWTEERRCFPDCYHPITIWGHFASLNMLRKKRQESQTMYLSYTCQLLFSMTVARPNPDAFYYPFEHVMRDGWPSAIETFQCFAEVPLVPRLEDFLTLSQTDVDDKLYMSHPQVIFPARIYQNIHAC